MLSVMVPDGQSSDPVYSRVAHHHSALQNCPVGCFRASGVLQHLLHAMTIMRGLPEVHAAPADPQALRQR